MDREGRLIFPRTPNGRIGRKHYLREQAGPKVTDVWTDIPPLQFSASERLGYPTQKPLALLERIISASSNEGGVVLDPFCGCGTAIAAAHQLGRKWIGIDITHLSIALQKYRLKDMFGLEEGKDYEVIGEPRDVASARQLARDDRYQFQWWALSLVRAKPLGGDGGKKGKKGSDRGIDGILNFFDYGSTKPKHAIIQVKSGHVRPTDIRDLKGTVDREKAEIGVFITLEPPTREMRTEAISTGYYRSNSGVDYPKIQVLTIEELLEGKMIQMPSPFGTFKQAQRAKARPEHTQPALFDADDEDL